METFASKIRYGGEPRFNPMLEERGGWATGEGARIALLKEQLLIAKFLGPKPPPQDLVKWITTLNQELRGSEVAFCINVGK